MSASESGQGTGQAAGARRVHVFDTTLRDGEQSPGISLNTREKLDVAEQLARLGVDVIEAGFPITSLGDFEAVSTIAANVRGPIICGLARCVDADIDRAAEALKSAVRPLIHVFVSTSDIHIERKLKKTKDEVLAMAVEGVKRAKRHTELVEFSPEDATRTEFDYLCKVVAAAIEAGATTINIPDTVGYATPHEFGSLIASLREAIPALDGVILSVHCHNDLGLAVANSLEAVVNGATQVECTINGLGERAGNAAMEEIVMILDTRRRTLGCETGIDTAQIAHTSRLVSTMTGYQIQFNKAIVGRNAFAHSSGIHTDGMLKDRTTYEIIDPTRIGLSMADSKVILGKTSGRHAFRSHLAQLGFELSEDEVEKAFTRFKELADKKAEITDNDLEAIIADQARTAEEVFKLDYIDTSSGTGKMPTATIRLRRNGDLIENTATGDGQVDASCRAIQQATGVKARLLSYQVSAITGSLDAQGDVNIQLEIEGQSFLGRGVDTDIVAASARAYLNAINKYVSWRASDSSDALRNE